MRRAHFLADRVYAALTKFGADDSELSADVMALCLAVSEDDNADGYLWEHGVLVDLLVALFWAYNDCHTGQGSTEYAVLSDLVDIYTPGPSEHGPEEGSEAEYLYQEACKALGCPQ